MGKFRIVISILALYLVYTACQAQKNPGKVIHKIYNNAMNSSSSHEVLRYLCKETAGRLPGTTQSEKAIAFVEETLKKNGADSVWLIPINAPGWKEIRRPVTRVILNGARCFDLKSISLGQCVTTTGSGIEAQIVIVNTKGQIDSLGEKGLKGKIVFFNNKMEMPYDYGKYAWARVFGPSLVSKYGALGVLIRSLTTKMDDNPHTGVTIYSEDAPKIPAVALSWQAADSLEISLEKNPLLNVHLETFCENPGDVKTFNVVSEIKGSQFPNEIILLSGHLDAWHNTQGAHDDGGGIAEIVDVIRIFKELKIQPKHTIRVMPYMDEEQYNTGIIQYESLEANKKIKHILRIEVDGGSGIPNGFDIEADSRVFTKQDKWRKYLVPLKINNLFFSAENDKARPHSSENNTILSYFSCKDLHYFDYHHSENDIFEAVDKKNLQSGSAALATFIYLLDKMDVIDTSKK
jgi:carboxypeptidase Q